MSKKTATLIRTLTAAPIPALCLVIILRLIRTDFFINDVHFCLFIFFLSAFPALSYLLSRTVPTLKKGGRNTERNLAIIFSVSGYIGAFITALVGGTPNEKVLAATYLFSAVITAVLTLVKFKSSGHTCALSGPVAMLCYSVNFWFAFGFLLLIPVYASSIKLDRHTFWQLLAGTAVPIAAMLVSIAIFAGF